MSSLAATGSGLSKRRRTVEGSCWPCKQRRVKCDLQRPVCRRCVQSHQGDCNYDKFLLKWKQRPASSVPNTQLQLSLEQILDGSPLLVNERRAIDYFKVRLWPLFSTIHEPCPPPIALALRSQPVLHALYVFAEEHRALQEGVSSKQTSERRRLHALTAIRDQLGDNKAEQTALPALLVAVLLLYFLEGYVNCTNDDASTRCHLTGALAIINALGGFLSVWSSSDRITRMLLSELASTDLTDALLQDRRPSFPATVWGFMEPGSAWWEDVPGSASLGSVLSIMSEMSCYHHELTAGCSVDINKGQEFEYALQPTYGMLDYGGTTCVEVGSRSEVTPHFSTASLCLIRSFQHAGLIYLYSAIHNIPKEHFLVQQHVNACLECIHSMGTRSKAQNCALFPLYVAGAHTITDTHRSSVLGILDNIHANIMFQSVISIGSALRQVWECTPCPSTWTDIFQNSAPCTLVI
ncbi:fungal-specific transcription factor domain-containing protein [Phaeosphaeria sp. MPI-PUGE-AT-0046c]|nr:fungal-specific transcription factor domain-containing protein [Phaeosphaeria sp. MPI-PUGE-AT-0046c]